MKGVALQTGPLARALVVVLALACPASAQQRPLVTEDPEVIGAGRLLLEAGVDASHKAHYPASGLQGNLVRVPVLGISVGLSSIAELQIDGGPFNQLTITGREPAALSNLLTVTGDTTHDVEDIVIGTKIRLVAESARRPALGFRFATRLPNASNESGLGLDTTDFYASVLGAKTIRSIRLVGNIGSGILSDPTVGQRQDDVLTYGVSLARAITSRAEIVAELNGRVSRPVPYPGTETRGVLNLGARYTTGPVRFDASLFFGTTTIDPRVGASMGLTYVFRAFNVP